MALAASPLLHCPIRGALRVRARARDGLTFTEEKRRIDFIRHLLSRGYPKENIETETVILQLGHTGQNSLRADVVVYDCRKATVENLSLEDRRRHTDLIAEIKRENWSATSAKEHQLKPGLQLLPKKTALGVYWDDIEQTLLFKELRDGVMLLFEASLSHLPPFGSRFAVKPIRHRDLRQMSDLVGLFSKFDDILHQAGNDLEERYELLLQIILIKIYDEQLNRPINGEMVLQDFSITTLSEEEILCVCNSALEMALVLYQKHLGRPIEKELTARPGTLRSISQQLCRVNLLESSPQVMQDFYMYFARHLYRVDLAQIFTPYEIVDFIVRITNPRFGDVVKDPACGSADFLVAAYRIARERHSAEIADQVYGADEGTRAVQISVLNMILNGDGRTNIVRENSLEAVDRHKDRYTLLLCNPPFGTRIVERRPLILQKFDLAHDQQNRRMASQETGILFAELCVKSARPGVGRIAIILPNGYLGNRSERYLALRRWLLCATKIVAVVGFPRFTFKRSGADVSASVVVMEKRLTPLKRPEDSEDYPIHFNLLNRVGWDVSNKRAERQFLVSENDGATILDENNDPIPAADFEDALRELYSSPIVEAFPWSAQGIPNAGISDGWAVYASEIYGSPDLILDPKRRSRKYASAVEDVKAVSYFRLGDMLEPVTRRFRRDAAKRYRYVRIETIYETFGAYEWEEHRGWSLPDRAKHLAAPGDIFIAHIWSSVGKWFIAGPDAAAGDLVATNGCYHFGVREGMSDFLPDLIYGLSTEIFRVQMRALATGSDGLSVVSEDDVMGIVLPHLENDQLRGQRQARLTDMQTGGLPIGVIVHEHIKHHHPELDVPQRPSHVAQV
jgi:type I restriction enzyme M protein